MLWRIVRFIAGLIIGVALWWTCADVWNHPLASMAQPLVHIDRRLRDCELNAVGRTIVVQPLRDTMPLANIPADQLTYNVILVIALFASNRAPFSDRNLRAFAIAFIILLLLHPIGLFVSIESTYANQLGDWSDQHYGDTAAHIWINVEVFYRLIGMFGVAFAAWWIGSADRINASPSSRT